jgi:hypothetical protein
LQRRFSTASLTLWLLEHGGADLTKVTNTGDTVWSVLESLLEDENDDPELTDLLRVMVLRDSLPPSREYCRKGQS